MKNLILKICSILLLLLLSLTVISCNKEKEPTIEVVPTEEAAKTPEVMVDEIFEVHTESQKEYLAGDYRYISLYAKGVEELSKPNPVKLTWNIEGISNDISYKVYLSEDNFKTQKEYVVNTNSIELINLKINTPYFWYVEANDIKTSVKTFKIDAIAPRNLNIEGLTNARDLGGYLIRENKYSNQGLIYRSSRLNENETTTNLITEAGIKEMLEVLNIKSELDIRRVDNNENGGITSSPLGETVKYYSIPMSSGGNCILLNKEVLKDVFAVLGDEKNYPVVIHCSIGTDRTGAICFLINALLGVSEEDLYRDYLFSNFGEIGKGRTPSAIDTYLINVGTAQGNTLAEKTYNYLVSLGVKEKDLNNLIKIMTE